MQNQNQNDDYITIDLLQIIKALWAKKWIILLCMFIAGQACFLYAQFLIAPTYKATATLYVNNKNTGSSSYISTTEISAAKSLVETYSVIAKTRSTLEETIKACGVNYTTEELGKLISVSDVSDTEIFAVTVTSTNPEEAALIANTLAQVLPSKIAGIVDGSNVKIVDKAVVPDKKAGPSISKYTAIGIFIGALIPCAIIFIKELLDDKIHGEEYLTDNYNIPVLASIPDLMVKNN